MQKLKIIGSINYFNIKSHIPFIVHLHNGLAISNNIERLHYYFGTEKFVADIGILSFQALHLQPYIFAEIEENFETKPPHAITSIYIEAILFMLNSLWFVKDNSVNLINLHAYPEDENIERHQRTSDRYFSNSLGQYEETNWSEDEILDAMQFVPILYELQKKYDENNPKWENINFEMGIRTSGKNELIFKITDRILKAYMFLTLARTTDFFPQKLCFYVAVFETLFASDGNEIAFKLSLQAAKYLGGESDVIQKNFTIIKTAYNIRSRFIHGGFIAKKDSKEKLLSLSMDMDYLTRQLFRKVILNDIDTFSKNENDFNIWLQSLIF